MGAKKKQGTLAVKTWIWLKGFNSKALEDMRGECGDVVAKSLCGRWLEVQGIDSDGDFRMLAGIVPEYILKSEVAHVIESIERPNDPPVKIARIDRTKVPKAKVSKYVWTPKSFMPNPRSTKAHLEQLLSAVVSQLNDLGTENARLKNQISKFKNNGHK